MAVSMEDRGKMIVAVGLGTPKENCPAANKSEAHKAEWDKIVKEVATLRAQGIEPDVPHEWAI